MASNKCLVTKGNRWRRFCAYSILAWIFPLLYVLQEKELYAVIYLDFWNYNPLDIMTNIPICSIIVLTASNFYFSVSSLYHIWRNKFTTRNIQRSVEKKFIDEFSLLMKFILIGGLVSFICLISYLFGWMACFIIFYTLYAYQGFIMTLLFMNRKDVIRSISPSNLLTSLVFKKLEARWILEQTKSHFLKRKGILFIYLFVHSLLFFFNNFNLLYIFYFIFYILLHYYILYIIIL